ncbi:MAG TPA: hypothetical protein VMW75_18980 [Thermoanaerobaculia bacterium]|nr:hypothetical protein [Thermoanaerobaculia bacterium]
MTSGRNTAPGLAVLNGPAAVVFWGGGKEIERVAREKQRRSPRRRSPRRLRPAPTCSSR